MFKYKVKGETNGDYTIRERVGTELAGSKSTQRFERRNGRGILLSYRSSVYVRIFGRATALTRPIREKRAWKLSCVASLNISRNRWDFKRKVLACRQRYYVSNHGFFYTVPTHSIICYIGFKYNSSQRAFCKGLLYYYYELVIHASTKL